MTLVYSVISQRCTQTVLLFLENTDRTEARPEAGKHRLRSDFTLKINTNPTIPAKIPPSNDANTIHQMLHRLVPILNTTKSEERSDLPTSLFALIFLHVFPEVDIVTCTFDADPEQFEPN